MLFVTKKQKQKQNKNKQTKKKKTKKQDVYFGKLNFRMKHILYHLT
jgi:hypothetical protein